MDACVDARGRWIHRRRRRARTKEGAKVRAKRTNDDDDDDDDDDDGRSVEEDSSRMRSNGLSRGHTRGGGHVRVHDSKIDLVPRVR